MKIAFSPANMSATNYFPSLNSWFVFFSTTDNYEASFVNKGHLKIHTTTYGKIALISLATKTWNNIQSQITDPMINTFSPNKLNFFSLNDTRIFIKSRASLLLVAYKYKEYQF